MSRITELTVYWQCSHLRGGGANGLGIGLSYTSRTRMGIFAGSHIGGLGFGRVREMGMPGQSLVSQTNDMELRINTFEKPRR